MVNQIYPSELQLNKANTSDTEAPFLDLHLSISNGFVSSKIYDKRDDFDFDIVNFPFLDGDVPRRPSYGVYISQLIRFARVFSHVDDFNTRNKCLTAKLLKQGYRYHKLRKAFSKFYRRHYELISDYLHCLVPPTIGNTSRYNLRNINDLQTVHAKTQLYFNSFFPSVIREWNELPQPTRDSTSISSFKYRLDSISRETKPPSYYYEGKRLSQIYHTRLRTGCSSLNHIYSRKKS